MAPRPAIASAAKGIRPAVSPSDVARPFGVSPQYLPGPDGTGWWPTRRFGILSDAESAAPVRARGAALMAIRRLPDHLTSSPWRPVSSTPTHCVAPGSEGPDHLPGWDLPLGRGPSTTPSAASFPAAWRRSGATWGACGTSASLRSSPGAAGPRSPPCGAGSSASATSWAEARRAADILTQRQHVVAPAAGPST